MSALSSFLVPFPLTLPLLPSVLFTTDHEYSIIGLRLEQVVQRSCDITVHTRVP